MRKNLRRKCGEQRARKDVFDVARTGRALGAARGDLRHHGIVVFEARAIRVAHAAPDAVELHANDTTDDLRRQRQIRHHRGAPEEGRLEVLEKFRA